jgi:putative SOS response-associated peptidase YedK
MCGRYVAPDEAAIEREFNLVRSEWQVQADGKTKVPFYIHTNDQPIFAFAGLWDSSRTDDGIYIESVTHITLPANNLVGEIHNTKQRMPAILEKSDRDAWLTGTREEAWETLAPYPDDLMVAWPVSTRVNKPLNNDSRLIEPVAA